MTSNYNISSIEIILILTTFDICPVGITLVL